jgi:hypothetical protein
MRLPCQAARAGGRLLALGGLPIPRQDRRARLGSATATPCWRARVHRVCVGSVVEALVDVFTVHAVGQTRAPG